MTGPEHYKAAEAYLAAAAEPDGSAAPDKIALATIAQVHATLALAAATRQNRKQES